MSSTNFVFLDRSEYQADRQSLFIGRDSVDFSSETTEDRDILKSY